MTPQEGYLLVKKKYNYVEPVTCTDFGDCYVYGTVRIPQGDKMILSTRAMDSAIYVNKETKKVAIYNPIIQKVDMSKRKRIEVFK